MLKKVIFTVLFSFIFLSAKSTSVITIKGSPAEGFPLSVKEMNTIVFCDSTEQEVVKIAARLFCSDVEMVTGRKPKLTHRLDSLTEYTVIVGSIDSSRLIKQLVNAGKLNTDVLKGGWERFKMQTVDAPLNGVKQALVIAGSDRRGTAYGIFELSKAIGVSPLYWWADVTPSKKESIVVSPMDYVSKEPTVKYRGIFINDEDFGLQEWSQYTFDPVKDIGPRTYEKVFELLLRLKANYCWPAMHLCTKAFNYYAENKLVADRYGIIMGSSHHEPMLYNTHEWPYATSDWNPFTNMEKIMGELGKRVASNGKYENVYTVGIRGTEDGPMAGGSTLDEKTRKLEEVISRERGLLTQYVNPDITKVPQVFWPYKEVLDLYNNKMVVPDDITLGWVDDNHGYVRQVSNPTEQARSGGSGVYYHLSYWGDPADYLWLASTPPALIASEMKKAADFGANRVWIFNVGDIKPEEMLTNYCFDLAWDYNQWGADHIRDYFLEWSSYTFGKQFSEEITNAYTKYFQLAQAGKPEHINKVNFSETEMDERLTSYKDLSTLVESVYTRIPSELKDAYFELVYYPIICSGLMNEKFFYAYKSFKGAIDKDPNALEYSKKSMAAFNAIRNHTNHYNLAIKSGKWNKVVSCDIRDLAVYDMPAVATQKDVDKVHVDLPAINLAGGVFVAPMKMVNGIVYGDKAGKQTASTGGKAEFTFELTKSTVAEIHFYAKTPSLDEDSWFITINGTPFTQNDVTTGNGFEWIKVWSGTLVAGTNKIIINQREPNAQIAAIKIAEPGLMQYAVNYVPVADTIIPAWKFSTMQNAAGYQWKVIDGLSTSEKGVTNLPYTLPSVDVKSAPYIEQNVELSDTAFTLEVRCVPTRRLYEGRDLRFGISINDEEPRIFSIQQADLSADWKKNVLRGYSSNLVNYALKTHSVKIRLYALDPGVIFDQVLIYNDYDKNTSTSIPFVSESQKKVSVYPNPFGDFLTVALEQFDDEVVGFELTDVMGRTCFSKKMYVSNNSDSVKLPVSNLNAGTYLLNVRSDDGLITKKVVKD